MCVVLAIPVDYDSFCNAFIASFALLAMASCCRDLIKSKLEAARFLIALAPLVVFNEMTCWGFVDRGKRWRFSSLERLALRVIIFAFSWLWPFFHHLFSSVRLTVYCCYGLAEMHQPGRENPRGLAGAYSFSHPPLHCSLSVCTYDLQLIFWELAFDHEGCVYVLFTVVQVKSY